MTSLFPGPIVIGWQVGIASGWGTYGLNLASQLALKGYEVGLPFLAPTLKVTENQGRTLKAALANHKQYVSKMRGSGGLHLRSPFLRAMGDGLDFPPFLDAWSGSPDVGVVFFESAQVPKGNLERAKTLDAVITGSTWNAQVLERAGLANVHKCLQGIDPDVFQPGNKAGRFGERFVVFSGGKLEYRKGQDLVLAAFKRFHENHPDTILVTAWHNPWPEVANSFASSPYVATVPSIAENNQLNVRDWLETEGLPLDSFVDLGPVANGEMPQLLWEADVGLFPNRCEGGTNLVAMEAMACGVPCILSRNTGHLDLFGDDTCIGLELQIPLGEVTGRADLNGWGESSIEECVQKLEYTYANREAAKTIGEKGASFMAEWSWASQVDRMIDVLKGLSRSSL